MGGCGGWEAEAVFRQRARDAEAAGGKPLAPPTCATNLVTGGFGQLWQTLGAPGPGAFHGQDALVDLGRVRVRGCHGRRVGFGRQQRRFAPAGPAGRGAGSVRLLAATAVIVVVVGIVVVAVRPPRLRLQKVELRLLQFRGPGNLRQGRRDARRQWGVRRAARLRLLLRAPRRRGGGRGGHGPLGRGSTWRLRASGRRPRRRPRLPRKVAISYRF